MKFAGAVKEVTISRVHLVFRGADVAFYHSVHYGVEVANPRKLERLVWAEPLLHIIFEDIGHNGALNTFALKFGCYAENYSEGSIARVAHLQIPHQLQLLPQAELTFELANYAVEVGHHNEETYRLVVVVGKYISSRSIIGRSVCISFCASSLVIGFTPVKSDHALL